MSFAFHPEAEAELKEAIEYYEGTEPMLGYEFAAEVYATIQRSIALPKAWPIIEGDIRRSLIRRFPYGVLYSEEPDGIYIVAVSRIIGNIESKRTE